MATSDYGLIIGLLIMIAFFQSSFVSADPEFLQDVCVADLASGVKINGFACKSNISADDFFYAGLAKVVLTHHTLTQELPRLSLCWKANWTLDSSPQTIQNGEIFTFPRGLIHFQINNGKVLAAIIAGFNSQLPGTQRSQMLCLPRLRQ